jgi:hypothetical protein
MASTSIHGVTGTDALDGGFGRVVEEVDAEDAVGLR